ncbi:VIT1/CCC1 transporter family protein [Weissella minor]|uniref:Integral membrane protein n=1 Tax=Weissella minor TaxID=1620 RepID=A0A0R2JLC0_9LACO|nr:VIT family protein [Weissella minor]KRN76662.1 integral membrane protein [Weissella minor]
MKHEQQMTMEEKLNAVRAGVLGSNDGILTVVGVIFSVGAATTNHFTILIAAVADLFACALSMASGEYASVSAQADSEKVIVAKEQQRVQQNPQTVMTDIQDFFIKRGVTMQTSAAIAADLMQKAPLETILKTKYGIQLGHYVNPWEAALASMVSATAGGIFPLLAIWLSPDNIKYLVTILATVLAVALTGALSAYLGHGFPKKAIWRNILLGILTIMIHYAIGKLF